MQIDLWMGIKLDLWMYNIDGPDNQHLQIYQSHCGLVTSYGVWFIATSEYGDTHIEHKADINQYIYINGWHRCLKCVYNISKCIFINEKYLNYDRSFNDVRLLNPPWKYVCIGAANNLASNGRQVNTWICANIYM